MPLWAWDPGSPLPSYASTSVSRTVTPPCVSVAPSSRGATSSTGPARSVPQRHARWSARAARSSASCSRTRSGAVPPRPSREATEPSTVSTVAHVGGQPRVDGGELLVGEVRELDAELLAASYAGAGQLVGDPERHALTDQPLGDVGGQREALGRQLGHPRRCRR